MARSAVNDPLEKFRFKVSWSFIESEETQSVRAGFHDIQVPKRTTTKGTYREGTDRDIHQLFPGLTTMEDIVMSRGLIPNSQGDAANELYKWMSAVHKPSTGNDSIATNQRPEDAAASQFRKDVTVSMLDREGNVAKQWVLYNAFPVGFNPGSDLNADEDGEKSIENLTLAYEDFQEVQPGTTNTVATSPHYLNKEQRGA